MAEAVRVLGSDGVTWSLATEYILVDGTWQSVGPELPADLAAMWTFDDGTGNDLVTSRSLSFSSVQTTSARGGFALSAVAAEGTATTSDGFLNQSGYTVSAWVLPAPDTTTTIAFSAAGTDVAYLYYRWTKLASRPYRVTRHQTITSAGSKNNLQNFSIGNTDDPYPTPAWSLVTGTYDQINMKMYVDGQLVDTDAQTGTVNDPDSFRITLPLGAMVDDVQIWSRALTDSEVLEQYNNGVGL